MPFLNEPFSGGLVTSRPAHMLSPGEFTRLDNCGYRFDSDRLRPAEPRLETLATINSGSGYDYTSLASMQFDDATNFLATLTPTTNKIRVFEATSAASALDITTVSSSLTSLVAVPFRNQCLLLNGEANYLIYHTGGNTAVAPSYVAHGLNPTTEKLGIEMATGTWPLGSDGLGLFYEFWYTEVVVLGDGTVLESAADPNSAVTSPQVVDDLTDAVTLTLPASLVNSAATKYRVYRSEGKTLFSDTAFPLGVQIAELTIVPGIAPFSYGAVTTTSYRTAGTVTSGTNGSPVSGVSWSGTGNLATSDNTYAQYSITSGAFLGVSSDLILSNFGFTSINDPVSGIEISVEAHYATNHPILSCYGSNDGGTTWTTLGTIPSNSTSDVTYVLGGANNTMGFTLPAAAAITTNFRLKFVARTPPGFSSTFTQFIDQVQVRLTHASSSASGDPYPAIVMDINGETASVSSAGKPAVATTGCIHEDAFVGNDVANPSFLRWGVPGEIHSQPSIYFNDMETPRNDVLKYVGSCAGRVAIGMETCLWRANYLPSEDDATFTRGSGRAFEEVDPSFGIVGPLAATPFVGPDGRTMLAFLSADGLRITDMFTTQSACDDVDWRTMLTPDAMVPKCVLVNYPRNYTLRLYYPAGDSTYLIKYMDFLYHPNHLKNGKFKAVGPVSCGTASTNGVTGAVAAPSLHSGYSWSVIEAWKGSGAQKFFRRVDLGTASSTALAPTITTRDMFLAGFGNEARLGDVYLVGGVASTPLVWTPSLTARRTNATTFTASGLANVTASYNPTKFSYTTSANSHQLSFTTATDVNDASNGWDLLAIEGDFGGKENK